MITKGVRKMRGQSIAGMSASRDRIDDDFYATPAGSIADILLKETLWGDILEPACGDGAISKVVEYIYPNCKVTSNDLVYRGYGNKKSIDFLTYEEPADIIITNPPFSLFQEFAEKALKLARNKVIFFGKLQALEGQKRATFLENSPLRTIYVFKARQNPLRNGSPTDENGKAWASTMAFAWFVWEIGYEGSPVIKWL